MRRNKGLLNAVISLITIVSLILGDNAIIYAASSPDFAGGNALSSIVSTSNATSGTTMSVNTLVRGRKLVGAGWVFGIAPYNLSANNGKDALSSQALADAYKNGVLIYNDDVSDISLPITSNTWIDSGYFMAGLKFKTPYRSVTALRNKGYVISDITDGDNSSAYGISFTKYLSKSGDGASVGYHGVLQAGASEVTGSSMESAISALYKVNVSTEIVALVRDAQAIGAEWLQRDNEYSINDIVAKYGVPQYRVYQFVRKYVKNKRVGMCKKIYVDKKEFDACVKVKGGIII